jgi:hypothetical protein
MRAGVYYVRDTKFGSMFPNYELCKIGYTHNLKQRLIQFPNYDDLEMVKFQSFGKSVSISELLEEESKWASSVDGIIGYPFKNTYVVNDRFPFPKKFDDTTKLLKEFYGNDIFNGWSKYQMLSKNKMFRYFHNMKSNRILTSNWGSTEWFVIKK